MVFGSKSGVTAPTITKGGISFDVIGDPPPALSLTSREDMCDKGGITAILAIILVVVYVAWKYKLSHESKNRLFPESKSNSWMYKFFSMAEEVFVVPFIPNSVHSFIMWIFMAYFVLTIPMAFTRYYEMKWAHDIFALQGPFNVASWFLGCGSISLQAIPYTEHLENIPPRVPPVTPLIPPDLGRWERIDIFFSFHLTIAVLWLLFGFVQIFRAKSGEWSPDIKANWRAHRRFGQVTIGILCLHTLMMVLMAIENPVNQRYIIRIDYCLMVVETVYYLYKGISSAKKKEIEKHALYMFRIYLRSTMGSGSIRFSAWVLWLLGKFMPPNIRVKFDRGDCQTYSQHGIGDARKCWEPVFFNLLFTHLIVSWLEILYLTMRNKDAPELSEERKITVHKIKLAFVTFFPTVFFVLLDEHYDTPLAEIFVIWMLVTHHLPDLVLKWFNGFGFVSGIQDDHPHNE